MRTLFLMPIIHTLPSSFDKATQDFSSAQKLAYQHAFEADQLTNQSYMDLIEDGWRIHGICKKNEIDKTMGERKPDTLWFFAIWAFKNHAFA